MKKVLILTALLITFNSYAQITYFEAKDDMQCDTSDATVSQVSNYIIKSKMAEGLADFFKKKEIKYYADSLEISQNEASATNNQKEVYISGLVLTKKGSLVSLSDKKASDAESTLLVGVNLRENESFE